MGFSHCIVYDVDESKSVAKRDRNALSICESLGMLRRLYQWSEVSGLGHSLVQKNSFRPGMGTRRRLVPTNVCFSVLFRPTRRWYASSDDSSSKSFTFDESKYETISIDRSGLMQQHHPMVVAPSDAAMHPEKTVETELAKFLKSLIEIKGPISVAEFFRQALSHPKHGYYMKKDVFGTQGDFVTSPEISQIFGELVGIWCIYTWQQMKCPPAISIVELGPGRGTLQSDVVRTAKSFPAFFNAMSIHLVETSSAMRKMQRKALNCVYQSGSKPRENEDLSQHKSLRIPGGPTVNWYNDFNDVPSGPSIVIAQELFDALPIHQFEYTERGWCERMVDIDPGAGPHHFRFVLSKGPTAPVRAYLGNTRLLDANKGEAKGKLQATLLQEVKTDGAAVGDRMEFCPSGVALIEDIAKRVAKYGGGAFMQLKGCRIRKKACVVISRDVYESSGALIIDYGKDHNPGDSLRGIKAHQFVNPLLEPGDVDLSADVDFNCLKSFASQVDNVDVYGAIGQGQFLINMGIEERLAALMQTASDEVSEKLYTSCERLVSPEEMGTIFKAMSIVNKDNGLPAGFPPNGE